MLGSEDLITSLTLHELSDNEYSDKIKLGAYWELLKHMSGSDEDQACYVDIENSFESLKSDNARFVFAVSALNVFIQNNFTGPLLSADLLATIKDEDSAAVKGYSSLNNAMYPLVKCTKLFGMCREYFSTQNDSSITTQLFKLRCIFVEQMLMEDISPELFEKVDKLTSIIEEHSDVESMPKETKCKIFVEIGFVYLYFQHMSKSRRFMGLAQKLIGFSFKLTGSLGKRTKFQEKALPQLRVETIIEENVIDATPLENEPQIIDLNDDTLLEKISFEDKNIQNSVTNLTAPFLLHMASLKLKDFALEEMLREEVIAFLEGIIEGKTFSYCIATHAFFIRSRLEQKSIRRLSRCMEQLEEVVLGFDCKKVCARTGSLLQSGLPPMWKQEKLLAVMYTSIGSHKSALEIYSRLQMREEQINSLIGAGKYETAEKLTRTLLALGETPKLYCILGDTTQDITHYEKAWELSGESSARAMKSLGYHYFNIKEYRRALSCMQKSLDCNFLQGGLWFTAGCTALAIPEYGIAIKCFQSSLQIDDENGQGWSNLGACFERTGEMHKAFNCYKEATKHSFNDWRVWENFLCAAAQIKDFASMIFAYRQIISFGQKYCDRKILNCLVSAVRDNMTSVSGQAGFSFYDKVLDLFKFASSKVTTNFDLWKSYAAMHLDIDGKKDVDKGIDYLIKAYHSASLHIERSMEDFLKCTECSNVLFTYVMSQEKDSPTYASHLQSLKSILQILITKGHKLSDSMSDDGIETKDLIAEYLNSAKKHLEEVEEAQLFV
ncbi:hypothetical protein ACHWQZ_G002889 [Mnemiopsis leidyi]